MSFKARWFRLFTLTSTFLVWAFIAAGVGTVLVRGVPLLPLAFRLPELVFAVKLSLLTSSLSTLLCLLTALPVAYALARQSVPGQGFIVSVLRLPLTLPPVVSGVCLLLLFGTTPLGRALADLGLKLVFSVPGIIVAQYFVNLPGLITVLQAAIEGVDVRMEYVARTLGCSPFQAFCRVTLPLIRNQILAGLILTWGKTLGEFGAVLMLAGATRFRTEILPIAIFLNMSTGDMEALMVSATILILIAFITLGAFERLGIKMY